MSMIFWPYFTRIYLLLLLDKKMEAVAPYFPILLIQPYIIFAHTNLHSAAFSRRHK